MTLPDISDLPDNILTIIHERMDGLLEYMQDHLANLDAQTTLHQQEVRKLDMRLIELAEERNRLLAPHPDWRKRTCGECGYSYKYGRGEEGEVVCRLHYEQYKPDLPACPDFVPREENEIKSAVQQGQ